MIVKRPSSPILLTWMMSTICILFRVVDAMKSSIHPYSRLSTHHRLPIALNAVKWWEGGSDNNGMTSKFFGGIKDNEPNRGSSSYDEQFQKYATNGKQKQPSIITREMEEEVMASARETMDKNTVSRAVSSLIESKSNNNDGYEARGKNSLRDLASSTAVDGDVRFSGSKEGEMSSSSIIDRSWDTQQIAIASGATTFLVSPLIIPIIHSLLPPIVPFPSSISFTGAALLGTLSYIVALGDPTDQSNLISGSTRGALGDGVEVGGAVSRIVGRTALQSVQSSAPRLKAAARVMVDYDRVTATLEEQSEVQKQLSATVIELEAENDALRKEVALWQAVEDVSGMYKLEELKEMARYQGLKGYSTDGKNALLRRLVREGMLKLDLTPYF
ncbi:hypothetical protein ACHAWF_006661 [Thalassiosira exigua]